MSNWKCIKICKSSGLVGYLHHVKDLHATSVVAVSVSSSSNFYGDSLANEQVGMKLGDFLDDAVDRFRKEVIYYYELMKEKWRRI